ncbi:MAG TPA: pseudouridine-5'-phosphate glycosidase [Gemmatimonadaceae bacterium]|nr:pseudouridine-5'-phosphate glycosidase [Gemmatimonadaceae bacterium]
MAAALSGGSEQPVVALESSVIAQGLPIPANADAAARMIGAVDRGGAIPAMTGVVDGVPVCGLDDDEIARFLRQEGIRKVSARDLPVAMARREDGATTVAATLAIMRLASIRVLATGGIGGVHRGGHFDESADLLELASTPVVVVCSGAKSLLDLGATVERLETLGVPIVGFGTDELPGFFHASTGIALDASAATAQEVAAIYHQQQEIGRRQAILVVQPPPAAQALPRSDVERAVEGALASAEREGVRGGAVTPFVLAAVERATSGGSLRANLALLEANAALAAEIARHCA